jgi:radical SAM protein with 4Fe4S-binding SPASM domain
MDEVLFKNIVDDLAELSHTLRVEVGKRMQVALSFGGESLLHPKFGEFLQYYGRKTRKQDVTSAIYTNGILLDKYMDALMHYGFKVHVSLHKPLNPTSAENLKTLCRKYPFAKVGASVLENEYSLAEFSELQRIIGKAVKVDVNPYMTEDLEYPGKKPKDECIFPYYYMAILWNGDTLPCCHILSSASFTMGNVRGKSLQAVFNNQQYKQLRANNRNETLCTQCRLHTGVAVIRK